jgi:hypothetical protein
MAGSHETVSDFLADSKALSEEAFVKKYPSPVLIKGEGGGDGSLADTVGPTGSFSTMVMTGDMMQAARAGLAPDQPVYRVMKQGPNGLTSMITVGRTGNNDIVLSSQAVSKFHAHFSVNPETGACTVSDANSTNGTFVNGTRLEARTPCALADADEVSFSQKYSFTHYTAAGWYRTLTQ